MEGWWAEDLEVDLSQGDILTEAPLALLVAPVRHLRPETRKGGLPGWAEADVATPAKDGRLHMLAVGGTIGSIVVSHSCDIDKAHAARALLAPLKSIDSVAKEHREQILSNRRPAHFALPDVPSLGTCFVDFRSTTVVDLRNVDDAKRVASMNPAGLKVLHARLVAFFTRLHLPQTRPLVVKWVNRVAAEQSSAEAPRPQRLPGIRHTDLPPRPPRGAMIR